MLFDFNFLRPNARYLKGPFIKPLLNYRAGKYEGQSFFIVLQFRYSLQISCRYVYEKKIEKKIENLVVKSVVFLFFIYVAQESRFRLGSLAQDQICAFTVIVVHFFS